MQFNGRLNTETKRLLEDMDNIEEWGDMKLELVIFSHKGFYSAALRNINRTPYSSFGHLNDGQGVWRFTDKEKGIRTIRKHAQRIPITFELGA